MFLMPYFSQRENGVVMWYGHIYITQQELKQTGFIFYFPTGKRQFMFISQRENWESEIVSIFPKGKTSLWACVRLTCQLTQAGRFSRPNERVAAFVTL